MKELIKIGAKDRKWSTYWEIILKDSW